MNEWSLLQQLKQGEESAFKKIVDTWQDLVYNTAIGIVQSVEDAEDVVQEVFVQVYQSIHSFKGESRISTWLYRITVTKSLDHVRRKKRKKRSGIVKSLFGLASEGVEEPADFHHPGVKLENRETASVLFKAISKLPDNQKVAFTLNKVEGLSYLEIAEVMNASVSSVESLLYRAKSNLRKLLEDYYKTR